MISKTQEYYDALDYDSDKDKKLLKRIKECYKHKMEHHKELNDNKKINI